MITFASRTLAIMADCGVTFYDAVYHVIALERKGALVTADAAYLKKSGEAGAGGFVGRAWGIILSRLQVSICGYLNK